MGQYLFDKEEIILKLNNYGSLFVQDRSGSRLKIEDYVL